MNFNKFFKGVSRVTKTFAFEIGPLKAKGVPAMFMAASGLVVAAGVTRVLMAQSERLPETLREARALAQAMRPEPGRLNS